MLPWRALRPAAARRAPTPRLPGPPRSQAEAAAVAAFDARLPQLLQSLAAPAAQPAAASGDAPAAAAPAGAAAGPATAAPAAVEVALAPWSPEEVQTWAAQQQLWLQHQALLAWQQHQLSMQQETSLAGVLAAAAERLPAEAPLATQPPADFAAAAAAAAALSQPQAGAAGHIVRRASSSLWSLDSSSDSGLLSLFLHESGLLSPPQPQRSAAPGGAAPAAATAAAASDEQQSAPHAVATKASSNLPLAGGPAAGAGALPVLSAASGLGPLWAAPGPPRVVGGGGLLLGMSGAAAAAAVARLRHAAGSRDAPWPAPLLPPAVPAPPPPLAAFSSLAALAAPPASTPGAAGAGIGAPAAPPDRQRSTSTGLSAELARIAAAGLSPSAPGSGGGAPRLARLGSSLDGDAASLLLDARAVFAPSPLGLDGLDPELLLGSTPAASPDAAAGEAARGVKRSLPHPGGEAQEQERQRAPPTAKRHAGGGDEGPAAWLQMMRDA